MSPARHLFVPGRLCLAGEHTDWAATHRQTDSSIPPGAALVVGLQQGLYATVSPSTTRTLHLSSSLAGSLTLAPSALLETAKSPSPWRFAAAAAHLVHERYGATGATILVTRSTLPAARGLSSSAAVCVLVVRAYNLLHALRLTTAGEMDLAYAAERLTGSLCGRLDQVVAVGAGNVAAMTFDAEAVQHRVLRTCAPLHIVVADLGVGKDTKAILASLQRAYPLPAGECERRLHTALGETNLQLVAEMEAAVVEGDARRLGELFREAQRNFDAAAIPMCPQHLEAPVLHRVLADENVLPLVYGGKGVGSQGDGAVQFVAKDLECAKKVVQVLNTQLGTDPQIVTIGPTGPPQTPTPQMAVEPPMKNTVTVRTAVIPAAGFGTRLFPASRSIRPKALFPIVDTDGFAKPLLLYLAEQCAQAGIKRIIIVVGPGEQEEHVREVFSPVPKALSAALKPRMREYAERIAQLGKRVQIDVQDVPQGFGHAVACAKLDTAAPFALLLGDVAFRSQGTPRSCLQQALDAFGRDASRSVIGVTQVPTAEAGAYGVVHTRDGGGEGGTLLPIQEIVEKPDAAQAELLSHGGECSIVLGPYIFTPLLMQELLADVRDDVRLGGEIQLTPAMNKVLEKEGMFALRLQGEALDTGNAVEYTRTISRLGGATFGKS